MALGAFRFSLDTAAYQKLQRDTEFAWQPIERFGQAPLMQFCGPGTDEISLAGVIFPGFRGGSGQISQMRLQAALGIALPLVSGMGNYFGQWCVAAISEGQEVFWADGSFRKQEFTVTLRKYGEITLKVGGFNISASGLLGAIL